mmetsp:Transcript_20802/g.48973  ORF Transcript_20802/g.48973 Transcript_20802/m.48973 type:complete len:154 (-) Transcript_20802:707-1168(-)
MCMQMHQTSKHKCCSQTTTTTLPFNVVLSGTVSSYFCFVAVANCTHSTSFRCTATQCGSKRQQSSNATALVAVTTTIDPARTNASVAKPVADVDITAATVTSTHIHVILEKHVIQMNHVGQNICLLLWCDRFVHELDIVDIAICKHLPHALTK